MNTRIRVSLAICRTALWVCGVSSCLNTSSWTASMLAVVRAVLDLPLPDFLVINSVCFKRLIKSFNVLFFHYSAGNSYRTYYLLYRSKSSKSQIKHKTKSSKPYRSLFSDTCCTLTPSTTIVPASISTSRSSARNRLDLPAPVRPTMPIFSPHCMSKLTPFRAKGSWGR